MRDLTLILCLLTLPASAQDTEGALSPQAAYDLAINIITSYPDDVSLLTQHLAYGTDFKWQIEAPWPPIIISQHDDETPNTFSARQASPENLSMMGGRSISCTRFGEKGQQGLSAQFTLELSASLLISPVSGDTLINFALIDEVTPDDARLIQVCALTLQLGTTDAARPRTAQLFANAVKDDFSDLVIRKMDPSPSLSFFTSGAHAYRGAVVAYASGAVIVPANDTPPSLQISLVSYLP